MGIESDIWSLGCILYQLIYGRPPFAHLTTTEKLKAIPNQHYAIPYPTHSDVAAVEVAKVCLVREPQRRPLISALLAHRYLSVAHHPAESPPAISDDSGRVESARDLNSTAPVLTQVGRGTITRESSKLKRIPERAPLTALSPSLKRQMLSLQKGTRGDKWMRPKQDTPEKQDLRSVLERRIGAMRKFLDNPLDALPSPTQAEDLSESSFW